MGSGGPPWGRGGWFAVLCCGVVHNLYHRGISAEDVGQRGSVRLEDGCEDDKGGLR